MDQTFLDTKKLKDLLSEAEHSEMIKQQLQQTSNCLVKLYILQGIDFASRDIGSFSDPYLKITCGDNVFNERENYQLNNSSPWINKLFKFNASFPGAASLMIEAFDYDDLFGDDLIGKTYIDLDDRFFNPHWQKLEEKPIEHRQIFHHSSALSQGMISMWLEIDQLTKSNNPRKEWALDTEPTRDYQVRVCVFDTKDIPTADVEGTSDVYIKGYIDHNSKQQTDCHYRCMNGKASFNYRMLFDVQAPRQDCTLVLQAWDRDLFKKNDYLAEWTLDLSKILNLVRVSQQQVSLDKQFYSQNKVKYFAPSLGELEYESDGSFWLTMMKDNKAVKVRLDIKIVA